MPGVIYCMPGSARSSLFPQLIKFIGLDVEVKGPSAPCFAENFPLKKCPAYREPDGFKLTEALAIVKYFADQAPEKYNWFGKTKQEEAKVWQWLSFINSDYVNALCEWALPSFGMRPYDKEKIDNGVAKLEQLTRLLEDQLQKTKYLVGDEATLADLYAIQSVKICYGNLWEESWVKEHPAVARWVQLLKEDPVVGEDLKDLKPAAKAVLGP
ncbi:hypothetical protein KL930_001881 [Ogataea haglerorum]|uniref:GST C-terminal domain-containing protein n=1 Tax=Ogataea haglerorum TaxID=1937702 RepID=A0AAN6I205_9ASCO|nr:uncharacterized protein KL911_001822 [Ogataea haglerorum]KAG7698220.1 hypothetical protein KL915_001937 [Ogataea haglerorum]KAG7699487.1 hypothetical protein KL951_001204 [Ogataea haglerorum]KAG7710531.1 hypothetical protein KL950_001444 [Ogataea haglerorum]KAG7721153.1 hypothetical protein KL913_000889 [Ogataea haglerorum]KAG7721907.1 hypothetical protein KL949_000885 [Ogataea haglerorum]